jgi:ribosomal protein L11 methyltransferase
MVDDPEPAGGTACPYRDLHIYYIHGRVRDADTRFGPGFIGNWEEDGYAFLFFAEPRPREIDALIAGTPGLELVDTFRMPYDQWQGGRLSPFTAGPFTVTPPWKVAAGTGRPLYLDPGVVFGTGTHATTRDCLEALCLACEDGNTEQVLDLGTGTGLLALAAVGLGCKRAVAVDFNRLAARTARRNVVLNRMEDRIVVVQGRAEEAVAWPGDLLVANIHYDVMKHLVGSPAFLTKSKFILSGLMRSQAKAIEDDLRRMPVRLLKKWDQEGTWYTFYGTIGRTGPQAIAP